MNLIDLFFKEIQIIQDFLFRYSPQAPHVPPGLSINADIRTMQNDDLKIQRKQTISF